MSSVLLYYVLSLGTEMVESILSTEEKSVTIAAQMLLDKMCYLEEVGWFQAFLDILLASGEFSNFRISCRAHECLKIMGDAEDVCINVM